MAAAAAVHPASPRRWRRSHPLATPIPPAIGWRLVRDASVHGDAPGAQSGGPGHRQTRGVGFNLKSGSGLAFATFSDGGWAHDTGVFQLKGTNSNFESYAGTDADPVLFVSAPLTSGDVLSTGIFQKDRTCSAKDPSQPLVQVAVALAPGSPGISPDATNQSAAYGISVIKARMIPADIGAPDFILTAEAIAKAKMQDITIDVGTITGK